MAAPHSAHATADRSDTHSPCDCSNAGRLEFKNSKETKEDAAVREEISRLINQRNEQTAAQKASQGGGQLAVVRECGVYSRTACACVLHSEAMVWLGEEPPAQGARSSALRVLCGSLV